MIAHYTSSLFMKITVTEIRVIKIEWRQSRVRIKNYNIPITNKRKDIVFDI